MKSNLAEFCVEIARKRRAFSGEMRRILGMEGAFRRKNTGASAPVVGSFRFWQRKSKGIFFQERAKRFQNSKGFFLRQCAGKG